MSAPVSASLRASARAAYRDLLRAASTTFAGDPTVQNAFRLKMRNEILPSSSTTDPSQFEQKVTLAREVADVLRKNIVQARKVNSPSAEQDRYQLRITKDTELGDNESIKNPRPVESARSARRRKQQPSPSDPEYPPASNTDTSAANPNIPRYYSQLKKAHKQRVVPELKEADLEESFVRGSGPGGQSINKTNNNVQLLHKPTGIRVSCQETRSLDLNRRGARKLLLGKLDKLYNPGLSKEDLRKAKDRERDRRKKKKAKKKAKAKAGEAEGEEDEGED
ncbi:hypothetical protein QCA50_007809 [Cerrena zonata]|uniref:Prokaryotic-type class I peptide chain release factors domain-containing protein n=1 Tax=Cerrena zonata TaxID=2478898 RepID=A0AAW0GGB2_9APHY